MKRFLQFNSIGRNKREEKEQEPIIQYLSEYTLQHTHTDTQTHNTLRLS